MNIDRLVKMANQIGAFFEAESAPDVAAANIADHLRRFWAPRMRREIMEHVDIRGGEGLMPVVILSIEQHRDALGGSTLTDADALTSNPPTTPTIALEQYETHADDRVGQKNIPPGSGRHG